MPFSARLWRPSETGPVHSRELSHCPCPSSLARGPGHSVVHAPHRVLPVPPPDAQAQANCSPLSLFSLEPTAESQLSQLSSVLRVNFLISFSGPPEIKDKMVSFYEAQAASGTRGQPSR